MAGAAAELAAWAEEHPWGAWAGRRVAQQALRVVMGLLLARLCGAVVRLIFSAAGGVGIGAVSARLRPMAFEVEVTVRDVVSRRSGVRCAGGLKICLSLSPRAWFGGHRWCRIVLSEVQRFYQEKGAGQYSGCDSWRRKTVAPPPAAGPSCRGGELEEGISEGGSKDAILLCLAQFLSELSLALWFLPSGLNFSVERGDFGSLAVQHMSIQSVHQAGPASWRGWGKKIQAVRSLTPRQFRVNIERAQGAIGDGGSACTAGLELRFSLVSKSTKWRRLPEVRLHVHEVEGSVSFVTHSWSPRGENFLDKSVRCNFGAQGLCLSLSTEVATGGLLVKGGVATATLAAFLPQDVGILLEVEAASALHGRTGDAESTNATAGRMELRISSECGGSRSVRTQPPSAEASCVLAAVTDFGLSKVRGGPWTGEIEHVELMFRLQENLAQTLESMAESISLSVGSSPSVPLEPRSPDPKGAEEFVSLKAGGLCLRFALVGGCHHEILAPSGGSLSLSAVKGDLKAVHTRCESAVWTAAGVRVGDVQDANMDFSDGNWTLCSQSYALDLTKDVYLELLDLQSYLNHVLPTERAELPAMPNTRVLGDRAVIAIHFEVESKNATIAGLDTIEVHFGPFLLENWSATQHYRCQLQTHEGFAVQNNKDGGTIPLVVAPKLEDSELGSSGALGMADFGGHSLTYEVLGDSSSKTQVVLRAPTLQWPYFHDLSVWTNLMGVFILEKEGAASYTAETVFRDVSILLPNSVDTCCRTKRCAGTAEKFRILRDAGDNFEGMQVNLVELFYEISGLGLEARSKHVLSSLSCRAGCQPAPLLKPCNAILERTMGLTPQGGGASTQAFFIRDLLKLDRAALSISSRAAHFLQKFSFSYRDVDVWVAEAAGAWYESNGLSGAEYSFGMLADNLSCRVHDDTNVTRLELEASKVIGDFLAASTEATDMKFEMLVQVRSWNSLASCLVPLLEPWQMSCFRKTGDAHESGLRSEQRLNLIVSPAILVPLLDLWDLFSSRDIVRRDTTTGACLPPITVSGPVSPRLRGPDETIFELENKTGMKLWLWQRDAQPDMKALGPDESVEVSLLRPRECSDWCVKPDGPWASVQGATFFPVDAESSKEATLVEFMSSVDSRASLPIVARHSVMKTRPGRLRKKLCLSSPVCVVNTTNSVLRLRFHHQGGIVHDKVEPGCVAYAPGVSFLGTGMELGLPGYGWSKTSFPIQRVYNNQNPSHLECPPEPGVDSLPSKFMSLTTAHSGHAEALGRGSQPLYSIFVMPSVVFENSLPPPFHAKIAVWNRRDARKESRRRDFSSSRPGDDRNDNVFSPRGWWKGQCEEFQDTIFPLKSGGSADLYIHNTAVWMMLQVSLYDAENDRNLLWSTLRPVCVADRSRNPSERTRKLILIPHGERSCESISPLRIAVRTEFSSDTFSSLKVRIFAPYIFFNYSQKTLEVRADRRANFAAVEPLELGTGQNSSRVLLCNLGRCRVRIPGSRVSRSVDLNAVGLDSMLDLPCREKGHASPEAAPDAAKATLSVSRQMGKGVLEHSCLVSVAPCAVILNQTPHALSYKSTPSGPPQELAADGAACPLPHMGGSSVSRIALPWRQNSAPGASIQLRLAAGHQGNIAKDALAWGAPTIIGDAGSQIMCVPRGPRSDSFEENFLFLTAESSFCGPCLIVKIKEEKIEKLPYRVENKCKSVNITFSQHGSAGSLFHLAPGQGTRFAFPLSSKIPKLACTLEVSGEKQEHPEQQKSTRSANVGKSTTKIYDVSVVGVRQPIRLKRKPAEVLVPSAHPTQRFRQGSTRVLRRVASLARGAAFLSSRTKTGRSSDRKGTGPSISWQTVQVQVSGGPVRCLTFSDEPSDTPAAGESAGILLSIEQQLFDVRDNIEKIDQAISTLPLAERRMIWTGLNPSNVSECHSTRRESPHRRPLRGAQPLKGILKNMKRQEKGPQSGQHAEHARQPIPNSFECHDAFLVKILGWQDLPVTAGPTYARVSHSLETVRAAAQEIKPVCDGDPCAWEGNAVEILCPLDGEVRVDVYRPRLGGLAQVKVGTARIPVREIALGMEEGGTQAFVLEDYISRKPGDMNDGSTCAGKIIASLSWNSSYAEALLSELKAKQEELSMKEDMLLLLDASGRMNFRRSAGSSTAAAAGTKMGFSRVTARKTNRILRKLEIQTIESSVPQPSSGRRSVRRREATPHGTYIRIQTSDPGATPHDTKPLRRTSRVVWDDKIFFENLAGSGVLLIQMFRRSAFRKGIFVAQGYVALSDLVFDHLEPQLLWTSLRKASGEHFCTVKLQLRCTDWEIPEERTKIQIALHSVGIAVRDDACGDAEGLVANGDGFQGVEEIAHIFMGGINLGILRSAKEEHLGISVNELQLDNQIGSASFPVVICRTPAPRQRRGGSSRPPVMEGSFTRCLSGPVLHLQRADLALQELNLVVEEAFLDRCANMFHRSQLHLRGKERCADVWSHLVGLSHPLQQAIAGQSSKQGAVLQKKVCVGALHIHPARVNVTVIPSPTSFCAMPVQMSPLWPLWLRPSELDTPAEIRKHCPVLFAPVRRFREETGLPVLGLQRVRIKLSGVLLRDVISGRDELVAQILGHYKNQVLLEVYKIIGSLDAIGNPAGAFTGLGQGILCALQEPVKGFANGFRYPGEVGRGVASGAGQLARLGIHAFALFFGTLGRSVARGLHYLSLEDDYLWDVYAYALRHAETLRTLRSSRRPNLLALHLGVIGGLRELRSEVHKAFFGMLHKPMLGAVSGGLPGLAKGAVQGTCGLIFRPCAGLALLVSRTSEGVIHAVSSARDDRPIARIRQPPVSCSMASPKKPTVRGAQAPADLTPCRQLPPWASEDLTAPQVASAFKDLLGDTLLEPSPHLFDGAWGVRIGEKLYLASQRRLMCCFERRGHIAVVWSLDYARVLDVKAKFESIEFAYVTSRIYQVRRRVLWCPTRDLQGVLLHRFRAAFASSAAALPALQTAQAAPQECQEPSAELLALATLRASARVRGLAPVGACDIAATPRR